MSMQALGWLGKSLGINISGRPTVPNSNQPTVLTTEQGTVDACAVVDPLHHQEPVHNTLTDVDNPQPSITQRMGGMMNTIGNAVFGTNSSSDVEHAGLAAFGNDTASSSNQHQSQDVKPTHVDDTVDFDENGLPKTRNWYRYDETEKKWIVTDNAPEDVRKEYEEKQREREEERLGIKKVIGPPPPPGPSVSLSPHMGVPGPLMYADNNFFNVSGKSQVVPMTGVSAGVGASSPSQKEQSLNNSSSSPQIPIGTLPGSQYEIQAMSTSDVQSPYPINTPIISHSPTVKDNEPVMPTLPGVPSGYTPKSLPFQTGGLASTSPNIEPPRPPAPLFQPLAASSPGSQPYAASSPPAFPKPPPFPVPPY